MRRLRAMALAASTGRALTVSKCHRPVSKSEPVRPQPAKPLVEGLALLAVGRVVVAPGGVGLPDLDHTSRTGESAPSNTRPSMRIRSPLVPGPTRTLEKLVSKMSNPA